jgi:hypothetical protein
MTIVLNILPSYLLTFLPSYLPTFLPSYLLVFLPSFFPFILPPSAFLSPSLLSVFSIACRADKYSSKKTTSTGGQTGERFYTLGSLRNESALDHDRTVDLT